MTLNILILNNNTNPNQSSLHNAIEAGDIQNVQKLIKDGVDIHEIGDWGCTPLEHAVELGHFEIVQVLLKAGVDFYFVNSYPLSIAVENSRLDIVSAFINSGADINIKLESDQTVLMDASGESNLETVKFLVEKGADVNAIREDGFSAIMIAAILGRKEIFDYLAPLTSNKLFEQAVKKLPEGLVYQERKSDKFTEDFILAAGEGQIDKVREAIKYGVNINAIDSEGNTALCFASYWGKLDVVKILLENNADLEMRSEQTGLTALLEAAHFGQFEIVKFLTESGANLNAKDRNGKTALMIAVDRATHPGKFVARLLPQNSHKYLEVIQFLLKNGVDINVKDNAGNTALKIARSKDKSEIVQLLLNAGATED